jgi:hypothetical protein
MMAQWYLGRENPSTLIIGNPAGFIKYISPNFSSPARQSPGRYFKEGVGEAFSFQKHKER